MQTLTFRTVYVFFCLSHDRRRVIHWNVTAHPTSAWVWNQIIAATPWGRQPRYLLRDRDARYGGTFVARARGIGIETLLTPFRAPRANAIAERFVRTVRRECLDHVIVWDERHLRRVLREYVAFYNADRPHQALAQEPPAGPHRLLRPVGASRIIAEPVLVACIMCILGRSPETAGVLGRYRPEI